MKILNNRKIFWIIVIFFIIQNYVSSEIFFLLGLIYALYHIFFKNGAKIFLPFKEYKILLLFLIWGTLFGFIGYAINKDREIIDIIRDIFYYVNPLVFIYIGAIYAKERVEDYKIYNAFIVAGTILSVIALVDFCMNSSEILSTFSVQSWRNVTGDGVMVASISLAIMFSGIIPKDKRLGKKINFLCIVIMLIEFLITLSRTNILIFFIMYMGLIINKKNYKKVIKNIIFLILILIIAFSICFKFIPSDILEAYIDKILSSVSEISASHNWTSTSEIQGNWRGYETYCALNEWKDSNIVAQIFGNGLGKRIYVGNYAYTLLKQTDSNGNPENSLAVLHNGYATMLIKQGIIGVGLYILFYILIIIKAIKRFNILDAKILLAVGLIFLIQTYFLNGLYKDYCFFSLIILLGYSAYKIERVGKEEKNG